MNEPSRKTGKTITKISSSPKKRKTTLYFGSEKMEISHDVFSDFYLYVGKELTSKEYNDLLFKTKQDSLYQYGLSLAIKGCYSTYEVIMKLKTKANEDQSISNIITRLKKLNLLDDKALAKEYKESKESQLYGSLRIKDDLLNKKLIDKNIVESLKFKDELEHAKKAAETLEKKLDKYPYNAKINKGIEALERRGFTFEVASKAVHGFKKNQRIDDKNLKITGETLLKQYKRKYKGYDLRQHMFAALARRGFNIESINQYLEEVL